jgi:hypothetical protein
MRESSNLLELQHVFFMEWLFRIRREKTSDNSRLAPHRDADLQTSRHLRTSGFSRSGHTSCAALSS